MDVGGAVPADRHTEGVVEMMLDATQNFAQPLSAERLFGWHAAMFHTGRSGMRKVLVGAWQRSWQTRLRITLTMFAKVSHGSFS